MKTYEIREMEGGDALDLIERHAAWVPADVARAMYEVLVMLDNDGFSHLSPPAWERMQDALAAADGEAQ